MLFRSLKHSRACEQHPSIRRGSTVPLPDDSGARSSVAFTGNGTGAPVRRITDTPALTDSRLVLTMSIRTLVAASGIRSCCGIGPGPLGAHTVQRTLRGGFVMLSTGLYPDECMGEVFMSAHNLRHCAANTAIEPTRVKRRTSAHHHVRKHMY